MMHRLKALSLLMFAVAQCGFVSAATWSKLSKDAVVISVNGRKTTKREFDSYVKMMESLYLNRFPKVQEERLRTMKVRIRMAAKEELVSRSLLYTALCTNNVQPSAAQIDEIKKKYSQSFCRRKQSFDDLCDHLRAAEMDEVFMRYFNEDVKIQVALYRGYPEQLAVTKADMSNAVAYVTSYNAMAAATNALICATATNVLMRLKAGEDFAKLADEFSMDAHKDPGGDLGECTLESFMEEGSSFFAGVAALQVGGISDVLTGSNGYSIMKRTGENTYSQIFFRKPYMFEVLTGEALVEDLKKEKRTSLLEELIPSFAKCSKIEFPSGDVFLKPQSAPPPNNKKPSPTKRNPKRSKQK